MKGNIIILIFIALTILGACNSKQEENLGITTFQEPQVLEESENISSQAFAKEEVVESGNSTFDIDDLKVEDKKIIKDGYISIKTNDIYSSKKSIDGLLKKLNGYYESEDLQNNDQTITYDLKIRVPAYNFEKLISNIENGKDEITSKSIQARDVTEEFVDIETRLTNKREYLKRYRELLSKATTVKDILEIEENIRLLQEEIESKEGRLKYLKKQVSFSTMNINLFNEKEFIYRPQPQDKFSERVKKSLSNGWASVVNFVLWTIKIWPFIILTILSFFVIRRVIKKRKNIQSK